MTLNLSGWRQFDNVTIELHPRLTVITGANGAGKTTLLNILAINLGWKIPFASVPAAARSSIVFVANVWRAVTEKFGSPSAPRVSVGSVTYESGLEAQILVPERPPGHRFDITYDTAVRLSGLYIPSHRPVYVPIEVRKPRRPIEVSVAYDMYASSIRSAWTDTKPGGSSPIRLLKEALLSGAGADSAELFSAFSSTLAAVLPQTLGFVQLEERSNDIVLVSESGDFTLDSVSGGVAALIDMTWQIFLYTRLPEAAEGFVVLIDEPENHLHPEMQRSVLFKLTEHFQAAQFVVASHAPLVVTSVKDAAVYALRYADKGDEGSADRVVHCVELRDFERAGTASDTLHQVLGLDYTMPVWAANILENAVGEATRREFTADALIDLKDTLEKNSLGQYLPEALMNISGASAVAETVDPQQYA